MLVSKVDLLEHLPFSVEAVVADARDVNPNIKVLEVSSTKNMGIDAWCEWLLEKVKEKQNTKKEVRA